MANPPKIITSVPTFHEMAAKLEALGIKITDRNSFTVEKGSDLIPPLDWRLISVRQASVDLASKVIEYYSDGTKITEIAEEMYQYIVNHTMPDGTEEETEPQPTEKTGW